jgi:lipoprotein-anchoring transpeptidase ErfK/SrfK
VRTKSFIFVSVLLVVLLAGAVGAYAYDSSRKDTIAKGVTVAGVDLGGKTADQARAALEDQVAAPLQKPVTVVHGKTRFSLSAKDAGIRADIGGMVDDALAKSRQGSIITRVYRGVTGAREDTSIPAAVSYNHRASDDLVARVNKNVSRPAQDASVKFPSFEEVDGRDGYAVNTTALRASVNKAMTDPDHRTVAVPVKTTKPKVTKDQLTKKYPTVLVVDRTNFKLKLYKDLKLKKTYTVAVGQQGLETPAGLYHIQNKGVNVPWNVPNSAWAGDQAGKTIPGGSPDNPLKARWMGIFDGAGIHGTDEVASLGHAASHGCVRMAIPDVINLYPQVPVGAPIYIG